MFVSSHFGENNKGTVNTKGIMEPGFYNMYCPSEKDPVLIHWYFADDADSFGAGYNTHDGGGFLPEKDIISEVSYKKVEIKEKG